MLFSSTTFLFLFLPVTVGLYYILPKKFRNLELLIMSLIFYGWGEPRYIIFMVMSILVGYVTGIMVHDGNEKGNQVKRKAGLLIALIYNIGMLGFFKYTDFFVENFNQAFGLSIPLLQLTLPLGISFYSFQMMSYTIDVYRDDAKVQKNLISLAAYLTLFPQLIAGPIVRYQTVADQIDERKETFDTFSQGVVRFVAGLGKKVLLANTIGELYNILSVLPPEENSVVLS